MTAWQNQVSYFCDSLYNNVKQYRQTKIRSCFIKLKRFYILFHRIVGDNVDIEISARIERKERGNKSLHWTHQFAVGDNRKQPRNDTAYRVITT